MPIIAAEIIARATSDTREAESGMRRLGDLVNDVGSRPFKAIGSVVDFTSKIGFATVGVKALADAAGGMASGLFGTNAAFQNVEAQLNAFTKSGDVSRQILENIRTEAAKTPFAFNEMASATAGLIPSANMAGVALMDLVRDAEVLAASNPAQGLEGAAFALREAVSGDFTSIIERFNLPRQYINKLREEGVPALEIVRRAMGEMGYDMDLVSNLSKTATGRWSTFVDTLNTLKATTMQATFNVMSDSLARLQGFLDNNSEAINRFAERVGAFLGRAVTGAVGFLAQLAGGVVVLGRYFQAVVDDGDVLNDWLTHLPDPIRGVVEALGRLVAMLSGPLQDVWSGITDGIRTFAQALRGDWTNAEGIRPFHQLLGSIGTILRRDIIPLFQGAGGALGPLGKIVKTVADNFGDIMTVLNPMATILREFIILWGDEGLEGAIRGIPGILGGVAESFRNVGGLLAGLGQSIFDGISGALAGVDWSATAATVINGIVTGFNAVVDFGARFLGWVTGAISGVDWSGLGATIVNGVVAGLTAVADFGVRFLTWVSNAITSVDWGGLGQTIANGIATAVTAVGDFGARILAWIHGQVAAVDWGGVGQTITDGISGALQAASGAGGGANALSGIFDGIAAAVDNLDVILKPIADTLLPSLKDAWETLQPSLNDAQQAFDAVKAALVPLTPILGVVLVGALGVLSAAAGGVIEAFAVGLAGAIKTASSSIQVVAGIIQTVASVITGVVKIVVNLIQGDWQGAWDAAVEMVEGVREGVTNILEGLVGAVEGLFKMLVGAPLAAIQGFVDGVINFFQSLFDQLVGGSIVPDMINAIVGYFLGLPGQVMGTISGFVGEVVGYFITLASDAGTKAGEMVTNVVTAIGRLMLEVPGIMSSFVSSVLGFYLDLLTEGPRIIGDMVSDVVQKLADLVRDATEKARQVMQGIIDAISGMLGSVTAKASEIKDAILGVFSDAATWLSSAGWDVIQGLYNGLQDAISSLNPAGLLSDLGGGLVDGIGGRLGLNSPSTVMMQAGRDTVQGFVLGLQEGRRWLQDAAHELGQIILDQVNADVNANHDAISISAQEYAQALVDGLAAGSSLIPEHLAQLNDDVVLALDGLMQSAQDKLDLARISGAAPEQIAELQAALDQVTAVLSTYADQQGVTIQEIVDSAAGATQLVDVWNSILGDLEGIASGETMQSLQDELTALNERMALAVGAGAPQAIVDQLTAEIQAVTDQIAVVGGVIGTGLVEGVVETVAGEANRDRLGAALRDLLDGAAETIPDAVSHIGSILDGSLAKQLEDAIKAQQDAINFAVAAGWPPEIVDAMRSELEGMQGDLAEVMEQLGIAAAEGLVAPEVLVELGLAAEQLAQIPIDKLLEIAPQMEDYGAGLIDELISGVASGQAGLEDVMAFMDTVIANAVESGEQSITEATTGMIEQLEALESAFLNDYAQALIDGTDPAVALANLDVVRQALAALQAEVGDTADAMTGLYGQPLFGTHNANDTPGLGHVSPSAIGVVMPEPEKVDQLKFAFDALAKSVEKVGEASASIDKLTGAMSRAVSETKSLSNSVAIFANHIFEGNRSVELFAERLEQLNAEQLALVRSSLESLISAIQEDLTRALLTNSGGAEKYAKQLADVKAMLDEVNKAAQGAAQGISSVGSAAGSLQKYAPNTNRFSDPEAWAREHGAFYNKETGRMQFSSDPDSEFYRGGTRGRRGGIESHYDEGYMDWRREAERTNPEWFSELITKGIHNHFNIRIDSTDVAAAVEERVVAYTAVPAVRA